MRSAAMLSKTPVYFSNSQMKSLFYQETNASVKYTFCHCYLGLAEILLTDF